MPFTITDLFSYFWQETISLLVTKKKEDKEGSTKYAGSIQMITQKGEKEKKNETKMKWRKEIWVLKS